MNSNFMGYSASGSHLCLMLGRQVRDLSIAPQLCAPKDVLPRIENRSVINKRFSTKGEKSEAFHNFRDGKPAII
ncbi:hypothetical protein [Microcoleus sp. FACHB-68]|uniref:hypothetical protein n=1 Tax=Microcoleus sp. FACHB-68 TaxID=2692826 RepID=UPI001689539E|nr:hypothetical protein [Microcoleus sp. FACHB-68]MBD1938969.1 hypothetical protein [Microcoleus sp. FACHB-68]